MRGEFAGANALSHGTTVLFREALRKGSSTIGAEKKGRVLDGLMEVYVPWHNASESGSNDDIATSPSPSTSSSSPSSAGHIVEEFYNVPENGARMTLSVLQKMAAAKRRQLDRDADKWAQVECTNADRAEARDQVWGRRVEKARANAAIKQRAAFHQKELASGRKEFLNVNRGNMQAARSKSVQDAKAQGKKVAEVKQTMKANITQRRASLTVAVKEEKKAMRSVAADFAPANSPNSPKSVSPLKSGLQRRPSLLVNQQNFGEGDL
jgi:hypothetical protein